MPDYINHEYFHWFMMFFGVLVFVFSGTFELSKKKSIEKFNVVITMVLALAVTITHYISLIQFYQGN